MALSEARKKANKKWNDANMAERYYRVQVLIPKNQQAAVRAAAEQAGESVSQYAGKALLARMGLDEWPDDSQK